MQSADAPNTTVQSNGTDIAQVENNSLVWGKIKIEGAITNGTVPVPIDILLYKDHSLGTFTDITDADAPMAPMSTQTVTLQKKAKMYFKRVFLSPQNDKFVCYIPIKKKLLRDGESLKLLVEDRQTATNSVSYQIYGSLKARRT